jgi:hypothetical protein
MIESVSPFPPPALLHSLPFPFLLVVSNYGQCQDFHWYCFVIEQTY